MRNLLVVAVLLSVSTQTIGSEGGFGGIQLLDGYSAERGSAIDAVVWTIEGKNGLKIHFESGPSEGLGADMKDRAKYEWYREQTVNRRKVFLALKKPGLKTDPDLDAERDLPPRNILLVTFPPGGNKDRAANFIAKVANSGEMADVLLMALTFDPIKGEFLASRQSTPRQSAKISSFQIARGTSRAAPSLICSSDRQPADHRSQIRPASSLVPLPTPKEPVPITPKSSTTFPIRWKSATSFPLRGFPILEA